MSFLRKFFLLFALWVIIMMYSPLFVEFDPDAYDATDLVTEFTGPVALNHELAASEKKYLNKVLGPESFAVGHDGNIYTGLHGGSIVKLHDENVEVFTRTGSNCEGLQDQTNCGRPLGIRLDQAQKYLYVADAFKGLLQIDMTSRELKILLPIKHMIDGEPLTFPDDLVIDESSGKIYFTDASTRWSFDRITHNVLERKPSGRVLSYDLATGQAKTIVKGFKFPNGIELSKNGDSILIAETLTYKIHKFWLKGSKSQSLETFASHLPGMPDNIRSSKSGGYWVGLTGAESANSASLLQKLGPLPIVRKIFVRSVMALSSVAAYVIDIVAPNNEQVKTYYNFFSKMGYLFYFLPKHGAIVKLDEQGRIIRCLHAPEGDPVFISEVQEHDGKLLLGSFANNFVGIYTEREK